MTRIFGARDVRCPFSATIEMIERFGSRDFKQPVGPFAALRTHVHIDLAEVRDLTDQTRIHDALVLKWQAPSPLLPLPVMQGLVTVRPSGPVTELRMEGNYTPPLGALGRLFDRLVGMHIAQRTVNRFLDELGALVEREWQKERESRA